MENNVLLAVCRIYSFVRLLTGQINDDGSTGPTNADAKKELISKEHRDENSFLAFRILRVHCNSGRTSNLNSTAGQNENKQRRIQANSDS